MTTISCKPHLVPCLSKGEIDMHPTFLHQVKQQTRFNHQQDHVTTRNQVDYAVMKPVLHAAAQGKHNPKLFEGLFW